MQHASLVYTNQFGTSGHSNENINTIINRNIEEIPDHDLLVGGFSCQDYSIASTSNNLKGLEGKKGVLWWSIYNILKKKKNKPKYLLFENVDRLLNSPSKQKGRDFAIMLKSLNTLGYAIEWRIINAAEYGMPQRRKRIFFIGQYKETSTYKKILESTKIKWLFENGVFAKAFPITNLNILGLDLDGFKIKGNLIEITNNFNTNNNKSPFLNTGIYINNTVVTISTTPSYTGDKVTIRDILQTEPIDQEFYVKPETKDKWTYLKGSKKISRISKEGYRYVYAEGKMIFPDSLDMPSRTIITGEGGCATSRFKHIINVNGLLRRLSPIELERLNMFPDNHTKLKGIINSKRAFLMGNALVVGVIEKISKSLYNQIQ